MAEEKKARQRNQTPVGTVVFEHVWEAHAFEDESGKSKSEPKFSISLLYSKTEAKALAAIKQLCIAAAAEKFGISEEEVVKRYKAGKLAMPWRILTDDEDDFPEKYGEPFAPGMTFITMRSNVDNPPDVVDQRAKPITNRKDFYSGCRGRASFGIWAYEVGKNKGVTFILNNVQKAADGTRLSGRASGEDEFESIGGDDDFDEDDGI